MNKNKLIELRCKAWGITETEYYCNQCSDFSLEDMARAYRRGKNKGRADLEKENAELDCQKNRNKSCYSCANATERCFRNEIGCPCEKYKSYKEENAELRAGVEKRDSDILTLKGLTERQRLKLDALEGQTPWKDIKDKSELIGKLTKAKELIKDITSSYGSTEVSEAQLYLKIKRAEQFLKEVEK